MSKPVLRIGLSMRVMTPSNYDDPRDCIAQDWTWFLNRHFPHLHWMALPNRGKDIESYMDSFQLHGVILTGGNDIGENALRDETETALLNYGLSHGLPVFGVCRGLQVMHHHAGGQLETLNNSSHVACRHSIKFVREIAGVPSGYNTLVNSYHNQVVKVLPTVSDYNVLAVTEDKSIEALVHQNKPIMAIQWHPERRGSDPEIDMVLLSHWLNWVEAYANGEKLTEVAV